MNHETKIINQLVEVYLSTSYHLSQADPDGAGFDLDLDPIPITIGSIPHKVAFPDFEAAPASDDNDETNKSSIVSLPKHLEEKYPKLPGALKGNTSTVWRNNRSRWVRYVEYSYKKKQEDDKEEKIESVQH